MTPKYKRVEDYLGWIEQSISGNNSETNKLIIENTPKKIDKNAQDNTYEPRADVVIINALENPEQKVFIDVIRKESNITFFDVVVEGHMFKSCVYSNNGKRISLFWGLQDTMGMTSASILLSKAIYSLKPKLVIMTGICAGIREKVQLGDIVVANPVYDYGSGKYTDGAFIPSFSQFRLPNKVENIVNQMRIDEIFKQQLLASWEREDGRPLRRGDIDIKSGSFGSGASVIADENVVASLRLNQRDIIAIDMEAYGIAHCANKALSEELPWLVVKGVQDYADSTKDDDCRVFAAHVSAYFAFEFIKRYTELFL